MIRPFNPEDIEQVVGMLEYLRQRTPYRCVKPDWPEIVNVVGNAAAKRRGLVLVAEHDSKLTGVLVAIAETYWWQNAQTGARVASDLIFFSLYPRDGLKMLKRMVQWAFSVPRVIRVECGISSGESIEKVRGLYEAAGLHLEGTLFVANHPRYQAMLDPEPAFHVEQEETECQAS